MKIVSNKILSIWDRLSEMFPACGYQERLEQYLANKGVTDIAQLEYWMNRFERLSMERGTWQTY